MVSGKYYLFSFRERQLCVRREMKSEGHVTPKMDIWFWTFTVCTFWKRIDWHPNNRNFAIAKLSYALQKINDEECDTKCDGRQQWSRWQVAMKVWSLAKQFRQCVPLALHFLALSQVASVYNCQRWKLKSAWCWKCCWLLNSTADSFRTPLSSPPLIYIYI